MFRRRVAILAASGLIATTAVLTAFAGSVAAVNPGIIVEVTDPPTAGPSVTADPSSTPCLVILSVAGQPAVGLCGSFAPICGLEPLSGAPNAPQQSVCPSPTPVCGADPTLAAPKVPAQSVCPSPFESFQGETSVPSDPATPTPFESFQGETSVPTNSATPPPTSTGGSSSGGSQAPLFPLLISLIVGGLGLVTVISQRRAIRR
ncbi:MAG TPA: hypothetical protein VF337_12785 [Candidatus Limnocylindrales bacterium]